MNDLQIGDRVLVKTAEDNYAWHSGTLIAIEGKFYGVEMDDSLFGIHDLEGRCKPGYGIWVYREHLQLLLSIDDEISISNNDIMSLIGGV